MRRVGCELGFDVGEGGATLVLQVAPATSTGLIAEELRIERDGEAFPAPVTEVGGAHGTRMHVVVVPPGAVVVTYGARVRPVPPGVVERTDDLDRASLTYLRQSRYAPSDELHGWATAELRDLPPSPERAAAVASWVFERILYRLGASGPLDTAVDTLLAGEGVCRDFAHLTLALCRALEIPARLVAVYAPGLSPMDFHAVVEARVDGAWEVLDATRLAPRGGLVRIATGRDAADTAFVTTLGGQADFTTSVVTAVIDGDLPADDHQSSMVLA